VLERPIVVSERQGADPFAEGHRPSVRLAGDLIARLDRPSRDEPRMELWWRCDDIGARLDLVGVYERLESS
jgi:hypothetical protein